MIITLVFISAESAWIFLAPVWMGEQKLLVQESLYLPFYLPSPSQLPVVIIIIIILQVVVSK